MITAVLTHQLHFTCLTPLDKQEDKSPTAACMRRGGAARGLLCGIKLDSSAGDELNTPLIC